MDKVYAQQGLSAGDTFTAQAPGLLSDAGTLPVRLMAIRDRLGTLKIALHGHSPQGVEAKQGQPTEPPEPNHVRRFIDRSHALLGEIEGELSDIEHRL